MKNQKIKVSLNSPFHAGRVGYVQSEVSDGAEDMVVIATEPETDDSYVKRDNVSYFAVHREYVEIIFE